MNTLTLENFNRQNNVLAQTKVTAVTIAGTSFPVENSIDFVAGPVLLGDIGSERMEIATALTPANATTITLNAISKLGRNFGETISRLFGDSICVYRAADVSGNGNQPPDANFTFVTTIPIDGSKTETTYIDSAGGATDWYKYTYYNTAAAMETDLASSQAAQAGASHYVSLDDIRTAAGFGNNPNITDSRIASKRDAAEQEINGALQAVYQLPLPQPTNPIVTEIAKQLAAGNLIYEAYINVSPPMANEGMAKANTARKGGGGFTSLEDLTTQTVILLDAQFNDTTDDEDVHGFGGYPDDTYTDTESGTNAPYFSMDMEH